MQAIETFRPFKGTWPQVLLLCPGLSKQWNPKLGEAEAEPVSYCPGAGSTLQETLPEITQSSFLGDLLPCGPESSVLHHLHLHHLHLTTVCHRWKNGGTGHVMTVQVEAGEEERCWALLRRSAVREQASISSLLGSVVSCVQRTCSAWPFSSLTLLCV